MELLKPVFAFKYWENLVSSSTFPSYTAQILQELHTKLCNKKTISRSFKIKSMRLRFLQKNFWIPIWIKQIFLLLVSLYAPKCIITTIYRQHKYNIKMIEGVHSKIGVKIIGAPPPRKTYKCPIWLPPPHSSTRFSYIFQNHPKYPVLSLRWPCNHWPLTCT